MNVNVNVKFNMYNSTNRNCTQFAYANLMNDISFIEYEPGTADSQRIEKEGMVLSDENKMLTNLDFDFRALPIFMNNLKPFTSKAYAGFDLFKYFVLEDDNVVPLMLGVMSSGRNHSVAGYYRPSTEELLIDDHTRTERQRFVAEEIDALQINYVGIIVEREKKILQCIKGETFELYHKASPPWRKRKDRSATLRELTEPLMTMLKDPRKNYSNHTLIVTSDSAKLVEGKLEVVEKKA